MKPLTKKPLTTKGKWILAITILLLTAIAIGFIYWTSIKLPSWKYVQSFQNNRFLTSVDKTSKHYKSSQEDFFLIHTFDFNTNEYSKVIKIPIENGMAYQSEYMGYSDRYIWLTTPKWTAVDMLSPNHPVLDFEALKKRICSKNPMQFTDVIELAKVENYLKATNQNGDQFFVNLETFVVNKTAPTPYYDTYHKAYSVLDNLPLFIDGSDFSGSFSCVATVDQIDYTLKPIDGNNSLKYSFFSSPNNGPDQISVTVTDSTQAAIQNGTEVTPVPQTQAVEETRLTDLSFINAVGLGVYKNKFVFRYQKTVDKLSPWYLAWFDLKTKSITKEVNLETKGLKQENTFEYLTHWVSVDGNWAFFTIDQKKPVRIKL